MPHHYQIKNIMSKTITDKDRKNIQIARELKALTEMPGWAHLKKLMEHISLKEYVGQEELKSMMNDNLLAYKIGKKDGILDFFKQITLTIQRGGQMVEDVHARQKSILDKEKQMKKMDSKHGY